MLFYTKTGVRINPSSERKMFFLLTGFVRDSDHISPALPFLDPQKRIVPSPFDSKTPVTRKSPVYCYCR